MAKRKVESVYRVVDVVGESPTSWEEAGRRAIETASTSIRDLRVAEVVKMDMKVENGKVTAFRTGLLSRSSTKPTDVADAGLPPPTADRSGRMFSPVCCVLVIRFIAQ